MSDAVRGPKAAAPGASPSRGVRWRRFARSLAGLGAVLAVLSASSAPGAVPTPAAGGASGPAGGVTGPGAATVGAPVAAGAWAESAARTLPADLVVPSLHGSCASGVAPGWLAAENRRPGTPLPVSGGGLADSPAVGVTTRTSSVTCGDTVDVAVSAPRGEYALRAWRIGSYGGAGARPVWSSPAFPAAPQAPAGPAAVAGGTGWHTTTRLPITAGWLPGLYLIQVRSTRQAALTGWLPLVVRGPDAGAGRAPAVYLVPCLTWAAYNPYGGASLYRSVTGPAATAVQRRARVVALARPVVDQGERQVAQYTVPLVQTVEAAGVDLDYVADTDADAAPSLLAGRAEVIVGSHAEYATTRLYDTLEAVRNAGTNLAFLGANQIYWHVLLARDAAGVPLAVHLHRVLAEDPARTGAPAQATVRWRDAPLRRPEALLIGAQYRGLGVVGPLLPLGAPAWTGLPDARSLAAGASGEVDAVSPAGPPGVQVLARGTARHRDAWIDTTATYYVAPSGAAVLDSATIDTGCLSRGACYELAVPAPTRAAMSALVVQVVTAFAVPRFGATHPAVPTPGLTGAALASRYGGLVTGHSLREDDD